MRLVTRGDMDGLTAAVLITSMEKIDSVELIHPQDITDGKFEIREGDIMANLPYHPKCSIWFDHHEMTESNMKPPADFKGKHAKLPSVARVVYEYYNSERLKRFEGLVAETDRMDSAQLSIDDVVNPQGAILLGFTIDPRTGLGGFKEYFLKLVEILKNASVEDVLKDPEVARRVKVYLDNNTDFIEALKRHSRAEGKVVITDFRELPKPPVGNRFLVYTLYPDCNVSVRMQWGPNREFLAVTIGHSIFNRTCGVNVGQLCGDFGGGGHKGAGACVLDPAKAEEQLKEIIRRLNA